MDATLNGYAWLPRMIDKSRAARAGTHGIASAADAWFDAVAYEDELQRAA
jgi:hypothetical protein